MTFTAPRTKLAHVLDDPAARQELVSRLDIGKNLPKAVLTGLPPESLRRFLEDVGERRTRPITEAVILEYMRPALFVRQNRISLPDSTVIGRRLQSAYHHLERYLPAVGRLEFRNHVDQPFAGTAWMIAPGVVVTNRHVAEQFCVAGPQGQYVRLKNFLGEDIDTHVDFQEEYTGDKSRSPGFEVKVRDILFMEGDRSQADVALLRLEDHPDLPAPVPLLEARPQPRADIAVIGYPYVDPRGVPSADVARKIFGDVYGVKRLSPGQIIADAPDAWYFSHDASTLGGSSGSLVLDLQSGAAVGLHFSGVLLEANYAVNAITLLDRLSRLKLQTSVNGFLPTGADGVLEEAPAARYEDREGYKADFLGDNLRVPLPKVTDDDLLHFPVDHPTNTVLHYTHFSVAMSKQRRLCRWSAVNIHGAKHRLARRGRWRLDPRIPPSAQISGEVYGPAPKFSRGHMTRRQDPIWGDTPKEAEQGGNDTMHLTNAAPQMQDFNAGIWNELEDYALEHAIQDEMRICVFTGPVLDKDDPWRDGVQVPLEFWKVIAFRHDDTGKLTATGYLMTQAASLSEEEFVFGEFSRKGRTYQVPLRVIEARARLDFGVLGDGDPLSADGGTVAAFFGIHPLPLKEMPAPLTDAATIRWL